MRALALLLLTACRGAAGSAPPAAADGADLPETDGPTEDSAPVDDTDACVDQGTPRLILARPDPGGGPPVPYVDGQDAAWQLGPSGGRHLPLAITAEHLPKRAAITVRLVDDATGAPLAWPEEATFWILAGDDPCGGTLPALQPFLRPEELAGVEPTRPWEVACGRDVTLTVSQRAIPEGAGQPAGPVLASTSVALRLQPDPCECTWCVDPGATSPACPPASLFHDPSDPRPLCERSPP